MRTRNLLGMTWLLAALISGCGGGGDSGGGSTGSGPANAGWVEVSSSHVSLAADGKPVAFVSGSAFISSNYGGHRQYGLCLLICMFDDSDPGAKVTWENMTLPSAGSATSRYGTLTRWNHLWSASIPLVPGNNTIRIRASDRGGTEGTTILNLVYSPLPPQKIAADTGDGQVTLIWDKVFGALSYNIYWSATPDVTTSTGSRIQNAASPYTLNGLSNGVTYYFVLTTVSNAGESDASAQLSATAGAPPRPTGATAQAAGSDISVSWNPVPEASSFNLYWSNQAGVTKATGTRIAGVTSPFLHTGLTGIPYYYVVTALSGFGESLESVEMTAAPQLPPPAPGKVTATQGTVFGLPAKAIRVGWTPVAGALQYELRRCDGWKDSSPGFQLMGGCRTFPLRIYTGSEATFLDQDVTAGKFYRYHVISINAFGSSPPSVDAGIELVP